MDGDKVGKTVGNYVLTKKLGNGQYGVVYCAKHKDTGKLFAVKCIQKSVILNSAGHR